MSAIATATGNPSLHVQQVRQALCLLRLTAVLRRVGLGRSALYELMNAGCFPKPVRLSGTRAVAWPEHEIDEWIRAQIAVRDSLHVSKTSE